MSDFHYIVERVGTETVVHLKGDLVNDLRSSFDSMTILFETRSIIFDCDGLERINSIGVRHWLMFLDKIGKAHEFRFRNCRETFMDTALMISGFTRDRPIDSFYTCYTCTDCNNVKSHFVPVKAGKAVVPPQMTCEKCGNNMQVASDFDEQAALLAG
jgi:anti-anti-sigma regulatory factor